MTQPSIPSFPTRRSSDLAHRFPERVGDVLREYDDLRLRLRESRARQGDECSNNDGYQLHCILLLNVTSAKTARITITPMRSEEHTSELQSPSNLVCLLLL